jgi:hypothetical protein
VIKHNTVTAYKALCSPLNYNYDCNFSKNILVKDQLNILQVDWNHWQSAVDDQNGSEKRLSERDWKDFFEGRGFRSAVDYPASLFYK